MIAFIEGGMTIPMGTLTRNYLRYFRLSPTQCAPNMFRVLGCIEALNERMNLNLTYHDINWIYNLQHLKKQGYYLKSRHAEVSSLQELLESQPGRGEAGKSAQPKLPPPPPKSPLRAPQPPPPSRTEQPDPKRRREQKGKEVIEIERTRPSSEEEAHRPAKQQKISHAPSRGPERGEVQLPEPQAWLPTSMLGGEPLTDDALIRDYNGGIGCHVA